MSKAKGGSQYKIRGRSDYERNREKYIRQAQERKKRGGEYIRSIKEKSKCKDCGNSDWRVLEFDHVQEEKVRSVSEMKHFSIKKIDEEITKCEVRCCNCHRIKTLERACVT